MQGEELNQIRMHDNAIPPHEALLETITAEPWLKVSYDFLQLEGLCFDREGRLYFVEVFGGTIFVLDCEAMQWTELDCAKGRMPTAIKIHRDGRLFICCIGNFINGCVIAVNPDGSNPEIIVEGYAVDDMVFDSTGSFYFTEFVGEAMRPTGGVHYWSSVTRSVQTVMPDMAGPNSVALSCDEQMLWVTETNKNRLHMMALAEDRASPLPFSTSVAYRFTGFLGPDSCGIDAHDNLYVAMYGQGRVMVFNRSGVPIGQVLLPGREDGHFLRSTHPAIMPGTDQLIICATDYDKGRGSWLFKSRAFGPGHRGFQFS